MARYKLKLKRLDYVSPVDEPAQETAKVLLIKRRELSGFARAVKTSDELGLVFCWAFTSKSNGSDYYDLQGDAIDEDFVKAAADFMLRGGTTDEMHDGDPDGRVVFAMPMTPEIAKAYGIQASTSGLMVALKPSAEVFEKFKSGEYTGVSIEGIGERTKVARKFGIDIGPAMREALDSPEGERLMLRAFARASKGSPLDSDLEQRLIRMLAGLSSEQLDDLSTLAESMHAEAADDKAGKRVTKSRFSQLSDKLAEHGAEDPDALAAYIGRQKYGAAAFARMAARGRKKRHFTKAALLTTAVAGHVHMLDDGGDAPAGETDWRGMPGEADGGFHSHPWVRVGDQLVIGESENHTHEVADLAAIVAAGEADDDEDDASTGKRAGISTPTTTAKHGGPASSKETIVDPKELQKQIDAANAKIGVIAKLSTTAHALWKSLSGADADAFLAKSEADRAPMIAEFEKGNAVEYTAADGTMYTKRDDARLIAMAKRSDEQAAALADEKLAKRAAETFGKVTDAGKDVLKAVDGIADQKRRDAALALIKGGAAAIDHLAKATDTRLREGFELPENSGGPAPVESPETALSKVVAKYQADHKIQTPQQALHKALRENDPAVTTAYQATRN